MNLYLQSTAIIDWQHPAVLAKVRVLTECATVAEVYANLPDMLPP